MSKEKHSQYEYDPDDFKDLTYTPGLPFTLDPQIDPQKLNTSSIHGLALDNESTDKSSINTTNRFKLQKVLFTTKNTFGKISEPRTLQICDYTDINTLRMYFKNKNNEGFTIDEIDDESLITYNPKKKV